MHHAVEGAQVGPSNYTFRDSKDVIKISEVPRDFAAVLAGHIHRRQVLGGASSNDDVPVFYPGSVERTSFAEKDEPKGFFELTFSPDEAGRWRVDAQDFKELPSRPMVDLGIGPEIHPRDLRAYLHEQIAALDDNAIVRLKSNGQIDPETLAKLTAPFLRSVFPPSMHVQFSADLYRQPQDDVEHAEK